MCCSPVPVKGFYHAHITDHNALYKIIKSVLKMKVLSYIYVAAASIQYNTGDTERLLTTYYSHEVTPYRNNTREILPHIESNIHFVGCNFVSYTYGLILTDPGMVHHSF